MSPTPAVLAIDEGTTGTRAALVFPDGSVGPVTYHRLSISSPGGGVVEQDAEELLQRTLDAVRAAIASDPAARITAVGMSVQRLTSVLWDAETGRAVAPAMVWQDSRHADEIRALGTEWDPYLVERTGRGAVQSSYVWAARLLESDAALQSLHAVGRLRFGSIDSWLLWHLTGGRVWATTATLAHALGAADLRTGTYLHPWVEATGFPLDLLPPIVEDGGEIGVTDPAVVGIEVPIRSALGDQQAGAIGLGAIEPGQVMCVHGTGSFVALATGTEPPPNSGLHPASVPVVSWRASGASLYGVETYSATTGSAVDWLCDRLGLFTSAVEVSELAGTVDESGGVVFLPMLVGYGIPVIEPRGRAVLAGLGIDTSRAHVAHAVLEGIAHAVVSCLEANQQVAAVTAREMIVGGGMSASDPLMQLQADLSGLRILRPAGAEVSSLRGAAFLAGVGTVWPALRDAVGTIDAAAAPTIFEPSITASARGARRARWHSRVQAELHEARG